MSRIGTNVDSLVALNRLGNTNKALSTTLTRLSTGIRINSGKDDPAGLISGEFLRQEISSINSAVANNNRANNVLSTADNALGEIGGLLDKIQGVLTTSENKGTLSQEELEANQAAIDSAVSSIDRIAGTTQFAGKKLLDGSLGFNTTGLGRFDSGSATFTNVKVNEVNFNTNGAAVTISVDLDTAATRATVSLSAATAASDSTFELTGSNGTATIRVGNGQSFADAINSVSDVTGINATGTTVTSLDYGSNSQVKIKNISGSAIAASEASSTGADAVGTINGQKFAGSGLRASLKTSGLDVEVTFSAGAAAGVQNFQVTSGGARFQLGLELNSANRVNLGINSFMSSSLGSTSAAGDKSLSSITTGGTNSLTSAGILSAQSKAGMASSIVKEAAAQVATARAKIGAFQNYTIESNLNSLNVSKENLSAARSQIVDTDFAEETANLTRLQILNQAGTSSLAIANSRPQGVLALLGG